MAGMIEFVLGGIILLLGLRVLVCGAKLGGEDGKLWEVGVSLGIWAIFGGVGASVLKWGEDAGIELLWQWLALMGVGGLVACESMLEELRDEMKDRNQRGVLVSVEWVLRVLVWGLGCGWLWWMMG